jgi:hypothetical protein
MAHPPIWTLDDECVNFSSHHGVRQISALPAKIAETLYPREISVVGGEVSGR